MRAPRILAAVACAALLLAAAAPAPGLPLQELPPQALKRGDCALVLWTRAPDARRIVMVLEGPPRARIRLSGRTLDLARVSAQGTSVAGQTARQVYEGEGLRLSLDLDLTGQRPTPGGVVIPDGALEFSDPSGWSVVAPVGGLIACEP
ncbi:MAG: hypothetical protein ACK4YQ_09565 [Phenylobacterium sp.]|uniref:hypothetical protein n=1 Tax=Phenylobacterium sp. TaxID=1871053 RepID=UPI00391B6362